VPHHFDMPDPDQHQSEKLDPDPHQSRKQDPDPDPHLKFNNSGAMTAKYGALEGL
jgi:hypothetical protein